MLFFDVLRAKLEWGRTMKKISQTSWIFIAMVAGIALGFFAPEFSKELSPTLQDFRRPQSRASSPRCLRRSSTASPAPATSAPWAASAARRSSTS
jgi:hypothetical protein